ncbi:hypothetical protein GGI13_005494 [Coemansia sp. RSA 455]|nr:hypothetical protein GGI13_005494 [Coemansia sp. RSA 455]
MSVSRTHTVRGSFDEPPQQVQQSQSLGRTPWATLESRIGATGASSIYQLPRYAAYSQEVLGRSDSAFCAHDRTSPSGEFVEFIEGDNDDSPSVESAADSSWVFDDYEAANDVDEGSVISQEDLNEYNQEIPSQDDLEETASLLGGLEMNPSLSDGRVNISSMEGSDSETAAKESDGYGERASDEYSDDGGSSGCDGLSDEDDDDDDTTDQDIVLFAGKLHPAQGARTSNIVTATPAVHQRRLSNTNVLNASAAVPLDSQRTTLLPLSRTSRCGSFVSHSQRIAKKTHLRRSDRQPPSVPLAPPLLLLKDGLRMVESLRRMGKWQDSADLAQDVAQINRANQFYLDPVIIAMSPRLMPPSGQQS